MARYAVQPFIAIGGDAISLMRGRVAADDARNRRAIARQVAERCADIGRWQAGNGFMPGNSRTLAQRGRGCHTDHHHHADAENLLLHPSYPQD